jgi:hypothetical protein
MFIAGCHPCVFFESTLRKHYASAVPVNESFERLQAFDGKKRFIIDRNEKMLCG